MLCLGFTTLFILAAVTTLAPAFAQTFNIAQTEVRLEPVPLQPPFHDQFGTAVAASANGNTLAVSGITNDSSVGFNSFTQTPRSASGPGRKVFGSLVVRTAFP